MAYNEAAKNELKNLMITFLEEEFGASQDSATLEKYANAMARAIATQFEGLNFYPDADDSYPPWIPNP